MAFKSLYAPADAAGLRRALSSRASSRGHGVPTDSSYGRRMLAAVLSVDPARWHAGTMHESELTLKATPPRIPRTAIERARLQAYWNDAHERTALAVVAPAGFGKTTLLLQWRRRWLAHGARVAWLTADDHDDPVRFADALLQSIREASGRLPSASSQTRGTGVEALTELLGDIAQQGVETVLMIDDAERLPKATLRGPVHYLLLNAPANLHLVFGSRLALQLPVAELTAKGNFATLSADALRLRLEESIELLEKRLPQLGVDERAHLHDITEGWPLGLQLAIAAIEHAPDQAAELQVLSARHGTIQEYFVESLLAQLSPALADFLTRIAILDRMTADLCAAVTGDANAAELLEQLARETPILMVAERRESMRLHALARDFLLARFEHLPKAEQVELHTRAAHWFAGSERFHEAAGHALAAGDRVQAQALAARSLWTLSTSGNYAEAREWIAHIPAKMMANDLDLRLAVASILALGDRSEYALEIARQAIADPGTPPLSLAVALRVAAGAAAYSDRVGMMRDLTARWPEDVAQAEPLHAVSRLNTGALAALHDGATSEVRERVAQALHHGSDGSLRLAAAFGQMLLGFSHVWDGDVCLAEAVVRPALAKAERERHRRSMVPSLLASVLAAAVFERDQPAAAQALLANRLDVIERSGFPDNVLLAYRTLAYLALSQNDERRALNVLKNLEAVAERRQLPRLQAHALAEQVRIHALHGRHETVAALLQALEGMAAEFDRDDRQPLIAEYRLMLAIARTHAAMAKRDLDEADRHLADADALAARLHRGRAALTVMVLRAVVARQRGSDEAMPLLQEAMGLARIAGCTRLLPDTHPLAVEMASDMTPPPESPPMPPPAKAPAQIVMPVRNGLLTCKEAEILNLLGKGMSNKLIARTLDVSGETVKWHLKNLFLKLSAASRKHAVDRARLLGLVQ